MKIKNRILSMVLCAVMALAFVFTDISIASADSDSKSDPLKNLENQIWSGETTDIKDNDEQGLYYDASKNTYDRSGGGYYLYTDLFMNAKQNTAGTNRNRTDSGIDEVKLGELTAGGRKKFLTDIMRIGNNLVAYYATIDDRDMAHKSEYISTQTMNQYVQKLQNLPNVGSTLLATLMANTKPDYVTANRIYSPFSGVVGTILGFLAVMIMALLGITMALDIAYIVIPAVQLFFDGDSDGGDGKSGGKFMAKFISQEARSAVKAANDGGGSGGQSGSQNKLAITVYFKHRVIALLILGICLLYLVQGEIYSLVGAIIDLVSGFVGF